MIVNINKLIEPKLDGSLNVIGWKFGLECKCNNTETSGYVEEYHPMEIIKSLSSWTKSEIDEVFDGVGLDAKVSNQISLKNDSKTQDELLQAQDFDYNTLS